MSRSNWKHLWGLAEATMNQARCNVRLRSERHKNFNHHLDGGVGCCWNIYFVLMFCRKKWRCWTIESFSTTQQDWTEDGFYPTCSLTVTFLRFILIFHIFCRSQRTCSHLKSNSSFSHSCVVELIHLKSQAVRFMWLKRAAESESELQQTHHWLPLQIRDNAAEQRNRNQSAEEEEEEEEQTGES